MAEAALGARDQLYVLDAPVVLAGDYNVVPTDADLYPTKSYAKNALVQREPRALFRRILDQGWIDAIRTMHPDAPMYTFWDYKRNRWDRDAGLRIDHLLLNPKAAKHLVESEVDREVRGLEGASDHAPAWIVLRDTPAERRKPIRRSEKRTRPERKRSAQRAAPLPRRPLLVIDGNSFAHIVRITPCKPILVVVNRPIAQTQIQQVRLADMLTEITKAQLLVLQLGRLKDLGNMTPAQVSLAKRNNVDMACNCAREARRLLGANGILVEYHSMRHLANLESVYAS